MLTVTVKNRAEDPDIVATSSVLSLKCPLSFTRLATPCRGIACTHNQCFDAASYLELQQQAPTWTCPICNRPLVWDNLVLDQYVDDILRDTSRSTEQVTIEPDGRWHQQAETKDTEQNKTNGAASDDEDDDDLIEIKDESFVKPKKEATPLTVNQRLLGSQRDTSTPSSAKPAKRAREEVIDLTLSDDDEDARPPPKMKRPSMSSNDPFRSRPIDSAYRFHLPPLPNPNTYNADRFGTRL